MPVTAVGERTTRSALGGKLPTKDISDRIHDLQRAHRTVDYLLRMPSRSLMAPLPRAASHTTTWRRGSANSMPHTTSTETLPTGGAEPASPSTFGAVAASGTPPPATWDSAVGVPFFFSWFVFLTNPYTASKNARSSGLRTTTPDRQSLIAPQRDHQGNQCCGCSPAHRNNMVIQIRAITGRGQ